MSQAVSTVSPMLWTLVPLMILAMAAKAMDVMAPAKRGRRSKAKPTRDDSELKSRVAQLERMLAAGAAPDSKTRETDKAEPEIIDFKVTAKRYFFSLQENKFYQQLTPIAERYGYVVFSKVKLADLVDDAKDAPRTQSNYYDRMHVDYVLVTRTDYQPVAGIELNGPSHQSPEQQHRDNKKRAVFKAAKLPLLQFYNHTFAPDEIEQKISDALGSRVIG